MKSLKFYIAALLFVSVTTINYAQTKRTVPLPPSQEQNTTVINKTIQKAAKKPTKKKKSVKKTKKAAKKTFMKNVEGKNYFVVNEQWFLIENGKHTLVEKPQGPAQEATEDSQQTAADPFNSSQPNTPEVITHNNQEYHFFAGHWFLKKDGKVLKVEAPLGAEVASLPREAKEVVENNTTYYKYRKVFYTKTAYGTYIVTK